MRRFLVIEHDRDAPAGQLSGWAAGRGLAPCTVRLHAGQPLPEAVTGGAFHAAVVLGSEQTAYDDGVPWLAAELELLRRLIGAQVPVLGICFGGQVLARVLGARLYRLPRPEIGLIQVDSRSPALATGPWPSWHRDAFGLPPGALALAANDVCLQAFAAGPHLGLQFHPEATEPIMASWLASAAAPASGDMTGPLIGEAAGPAWEQAAGHAATLFDAWLDGRLAPR